MLRWKQVSLHRALCGGSTLLTGVREENEEELLALQDEEEEENDDDYNNREVLLCLSPERLVQSPASDTSLEDSSCWSPPSSSPVELNLPEDIQQLLYEDYDPKSRRKLNTSISLVDQTDDDDGPEHHTSEDNHLPQFGSVFTPWMCVFDLDAACRAAGTDQSSSSDEDEGGSDQQQCEGSSSSAPLPKQPLHLQQQHSFNWFDNIQAGVPHAMNQLFACLDPEYGRIMTIDEGTTVHDSHFPSALPDARLLPRPIPTIPNATTTTSPPPLLHCQYFTNFATEHNIEAIYVPVCFGFSSGSILSLRVAVCCFSWILLFRYASRVSPNFKYLSR